MIEFVNSWEFWLGTVILLAVFAHHMGSKR